MNPLSLETCIPLSITDAVASSVVYVQIPGRRNSEGLLTTIIHQAYHLPSLLLGLRFIRGTRRLCFLYCLLGTILFGGLLKFHPLGIQLRHTIYSIPLSQENTAVCFTLLSTPKAQLVGHIQKLYPKRTDIDEYVQRDIDNCRSYYNKVDVCFFVALLSIACAFMIAVFS